MEEGWGRVWGLAVYICLKKSIQHRTEQSIWSMAQCGENATYWIFSIVSYIVLLLTMFFRPRKSSKVVKFRMQFNTLSLHRNRRIERNLFDVVAADVNDFAALQIDWIDIKKIIKFEDWHSDIKQRVAETVWLEEVDNIVSFCFASLKADSTK